MSTHTKTMAMGLGLLGCLGSCSYDYRYSESERREWAASDVSALEIDTLNGRITVAVDGSDPITADIERWVSARDRADAEDHIDDIDIDESLSGGVLSLGADEPRNDPRDYGAKFEISTAPLDFMNLHTSNGRVVVTGHDGDLEAETSNGRISAGMTGLDADGIVDLQTSNGKIVLFVPADVSARFDASTTHGNIEIIGFADVGLSTDGGTHKRGTLGAGEATVTLRTSNGGITIQAGDGSEVAGDDDD